MTHHDCVAVLLDLATGPAPDRPSSAERLEAKEHLLRCSECWEVLDLMHRLATGAPPAGTDRARELYGCEAVRDRFHLLLALSPGEMSARDPEAAAHLGWCCACRGRFAELVQVERALARGEIAAGPRRPAPEAAALEFAARLVVGIRRGVAAFTQLLEGSASIVAVEAPAFRDARAGDAPSPVHTTAHAVRVTPGSGGPIATLQLAPCGADRVDLEVRVAGDPLSGVVSLRAVRGQSNDLVMSQTLRPAEPVLLPAVPAGRYVLELAVAPPSAALRIGIDVEPLDAGASSAR